MKNYGFVPSKIESDHYILGGGQLPKIILQANRNWKDYLPTWESQIDKGYETYGCTVYGTLNALETVLDRLNGHPYDYSERFNYILADVKAPGADPHYVSEIIRKYGVIEQAELPMTNTYTEFNSPKPMTVDKLSKGQTWLGQYSFGHEWVFTNCPSKESRTALVREALQYSPICVSVSAWYEQNGLFVDNGIPNNHWTLCYGIDDDGGLLIFDSYALVQDGNPTNCFKKLHPDHKVQMAKRYYIEAKKNEEKLSWFATILKGIAEALGIIKKKVEAMDKPSVTKPVVVHNGEIMKYDWSIPTKARHSVRVICDEEGLSLKDKNDLCATVGAESGWKPGAIGKPNSDGSRDYGIVQVNDKYWIGPGKKFESIDYVLTHPEECIRWMCKEWKAGHKNWWYGYKNGSYKNFL